MLYTDGVVEQRDPSGDEFGLGRLERLARKLLWLSPAEAVKSTFEAIDAFADGTPVLDDQTVVVVKRD